MERDLFFSVRQLTFEDMIEFTGITSTIFASKPKVVKGEGVTVGVGRGY
jgi:hypothetical protein